MQTSEKDFTIKNGGHMLSWVVIFWLDLSKMFSPIFSQRIDMKRQKISAPFVEPFGCERYLRKVRVNLTPLCDRVSGMFKREIPLFHRV